jgi:hypothetical protein
VEKSAERAKDMVVKSFTCRKERVGHCLDFLFELTIVLQYNMFNILSSKTILSHLTNSNLPEDLQFVVHILHKPFLSFG